MSATSWCPDQWNAAAARIRIAALTNSANISATVESRVANLIASRLPLVFCSYLRVCTIELCR